MEIPVLESLLMKLQVCRSATLKKVCRSATLGESFKNIYFEEHLRTAASVCSNDLLIYLNRVIKTCFQRGFEFIKKTVIYKEKFHL